MVSSEKNEINASFSNISSNKENNFLYNSSKFPTGVIYLIGLF